MGTSSRQYSGQEHPQDTEKHNLLQDYPEDVRSTDALQFGYKESMESMGISESKEVELSLAHRTDLWQGTRMRSLRQVWTWVLHSSVLANCGLHVYPLRMQKVLPFKNMGACTGGLATAA